MRTLWDYSMAQHCKTKEIATTGGAHCALIVKHSRPVEPVAGKCCEETLALHRQQAYEKTHTQMRGRQPSALFGSADRTFPEAEKLPGEIEVTRVVARKKLVALFRVLGKHKQTYDPIEDTQAQVRTERRIIPDGQTEMLET